MFISIAFDPGSLSPIFSIQGSKLDFLSFLSEFGNPKYVHGNSANVQGRVILTLSIACYSHLIEITQLFCKLVLSLDASPNFSKYMNGEIHLSYTGIR
jgi:hypothetical protein